MLNVKLIWESNIPLGAECRTCTFKTMVKIRLSVRLELWFGLWLRLELVNTT